MRVHYVTMQCPVPSEAFILREIDALIAQGVSVEVWCLRWGRLLSEADRAFFGLEHEFIIQATRMPSWRAILPWHDRWRTLIGMAASILREKGIAWRERLKALALLPRAAELAERLNAALAERPGIVHLCWGHYPSLVIAYAARAGFDWISSVFLGTYDFAKPFPLQREAVSRSHAVLTHSRAVAALVRKRLPESSNKIHVTYRGVRIPSAPRSAAGAGERASLQAVFVGRLVHTKRPDYAIEAVAEARRRGFDLRLILCGDGPMRGDLERTDGECRCSWTEFRGWVGERELEACYNQSDFLLLPTIGSGEVLPNAIKEAMARGVVPIVSDTVGIEELVEDGRNGFIVPRNSAASAVTDRLALLFEDRERLGTMSECAQRQVRNKFSIQVTSAEKIRIWRSIRIFEKDSVAASAPKD